MSKRLRYQVAMSLDGFIAGPNGEYEWIVMDPSIDFAALLKEFDTAVMGRKTYELVLADKKILPASGIVVLSYSVPGGVGPAPHIRFVKPTKMSRRTVKKPSTKERALTKKETHTRRTVKSRRA